LTEAITPAAPAELSPAARSAQAVAALRHELVTRVAAYIEADRANWLTLRGMSDAVAVTDAVTLQVATKWVQDWTALLDGLEAVRLAGPGDLGRIVRESNALFKSLRDIGDAAKANLANEIGGYWQKQKRQREEAYDTAVAAHASGQHTAAAEALAVAGAADTTLPQGTGAREVWEVESYDGFKRDDAGALVADGKGSIMVLSSADYPGLIPDEKAIAAYLRKLPIDVEPTLPGVKCKRVPKLRQQRAKGSNDGDV
jgi:hypothetical protein